MNLPPTTYPLQPRSGFTLIEILVVLGVFTIVIGILGQIFSSVTRTQRTILIQQKMIDEGRNVLDMIVDEIHRGRIDYAGYGGSLTLTTDVLRLVGRDGAFSIQKSNDSISCEFTGDIGCLFIDRAGVLPRVITSPAVYVKEFNVFVDPLQDPFTIVSGTQMYSSNIQPRVTIVLTLDSGEPAFRGVTPLTIQTSVTPRAYLR